jgi:hypothetical protein
VHALGARPHFLLADIVSHAYDVLTTRAEPATSIPMTDREMIRSNRQTAAPALMEDPDCRCRRRVPQ